MELLISKWRSSMPVIGVGIVILVAMFFMLAVSSSNRIFPNTDEWNYIQAFGTPTTLLSYLFEQHNDHRIPLQKLLQLSALYVGGFDFRMLVIINMLLAGVTSIVLMFAAKNYRGHWSLGDLAIPFLCMNFGSGMSLVGFELQFLSSVLFLSLFLLAISLSDGGGNSKQINLAAFWLMLMSWTGLNGVVVGAILSFAMLAFFVLGRSDKRLEVFCKIALLIALVMNVVQFAFWHPSSASQGMAPIPQIIGYFHGLLISTYPVFSWTHSRYISIFLLMLFLIGVALGIKQLLKKGDTLTTYILLSSVASTFLLMASIAFGRAQISAWAIGIDMHYGILTVIIPAALWMVVSKLGGKIVSAVAGIAFLVLSVTAFMFSAQWRMEYVAHSGPQFRQVQQAIASNQDASAVTAAHMTALHYTDSPETRGFVAEGILTLRRIGGWEYRP